MSSDDFHHDAMEVRVQLLISQMQENTQRLQPLPFEQAAHTTYYALVRPDEQGTTARDLDPTHVGSKPNIRVLDGPHIIARHTTENTPNGTRGHRSDDIARATQGVPPISTPNGNVGSTQPTIPLQGTSSGPSHLAPSNPNRVSIEPTLANRDLARRFAEMEALIQRIPGLPAPIKKSTANSFADSSFVDTIALMEMPRKFNFPGMKQYDGTTDPDDHIAQYRQ
ncbi:hypothetical protein ACOSQ3_028086 [Xanthoceras sorbifolium]